MVSTAVKIAEVKRFAKGKIMELNTELNMATKKAEAEYLEKFSGSPAYHLAVVRLRQAEKLLRKAAGRKMKLNSIVASKPYKYLEWGWKGHVTHNLVTAYKQRVDQITVRAENAEASLLMGRDVQHKHIIAEMQKV